MKPSTQPDDRTFGEKIADYVADFGGSWKFILSAVFVIQVWIAFNMLAPAPLQFDPNPFILLNLVLSLVAAFQAPFILMSQGRAEKKAEEAFRRLIQKQLKIEKETLEILKNQNKDIEHEILDILKKKQ